MVTRDIKNFSEIRTQARSYFCYLFSKNLPNRLPSISSDSVLNKLKKIMGDLRDVEGIYLLDHRGVQISPTILNGFVSKDDDIGLIRSDRAYYYRASKEKRCTITDPYPSLITQELTVTASQPIFDESGKLIYVACVDLPLDSVLHIAHPMPMHSAMGRFFRFGYAVFTFLLAMIALLLLVKSVSIFWKFGIDFNSIDIESIFKSTILLTLALAIFDLVKTLFEEEVLGKGAQSSGASDPHRTMVRFLGSIIIALSIEALMLVFKFAIVDTDKLMVAIFILGGVSMLVISLAIYIRLTMSKNVD